MGWGGDKEIGGISRLLKCCTCRSAQREAVNKISSQWGKSPLNSVVKLFISILKQHLRKINEKQIVKPSDSWMVLGDNYWKIKEPRLKPCASKQHKVNNISSVHSVLLAPCSLSQRYENIKFLQKVSWIAKIPRHCMNYVPIANSICGRCHLIKPEFLSTRQHEDQ